MFNFFKKKTDSELLAEVMVEEEERKEKIKKAYMLGQEVAEIITNEINLFFNNRAEVVFQRYIEILKQMLSDINDRPRIKNEEQDRIITPQEFARIELKIFLENVEKALFDLRIELEERLSDWIKAVNDQEIEQIYKSLIEDQFNELHSRILSEAISVSAESIKNIEV